MSDKVIEAEATTIDSDITPATALDAIVGEITEACETCADRYGPHEIKDEEDLRQSKRDRTAARKEIARLKARYDEEMGAIKRAVAEADLRVKTALAPLAAIDSGYKAKIDEYDERRVRQRVAHLRQCYEDAAPDIALPQEGSAAPLVPFETVLRRYGSAPKTGWTLRSVGEAKAEEALYDALSDIATAEATIEAMVEQAYQQDAKARYFRTLDLQTTLNEEAEAKAQRERLAALEAEREQRRAEDEWLRQMAAEEVPEDVVRIVAPPSDEEEARVVTGGTPPTPPAQPQRQQPPQPQAQAHAWVISVPCETRERMLAVAQYMKDGGIVFDRIYSGDVAAAYEKWRADNA